MPDENDPIEDGEVLLRAVPNDGNRYQADHARGPILRLAFQPAPNDQNGISLFREAFVSPADVAAALPKAGDYYVARLLTADIRGLQLSLVPDPRSDQPPGHCLIPELTPATHDAKRPWAKEVEGKLAELANRNIVHSPGG